MSTVAILGPGAIGSIFGVRLCLMERHEVVVCVRKSFEKFSVETGSKTLEAPVRCITEPAEASPVDWILLAVKCHQVKDVAPWLRALSGPGTTIAVLQNGVEYLENVSPYAYGAEVLPVVVRCPADRLAPGRVVQNAQAELVPPEGEAGSALAELYEGSDIPVSPTADFVTAKWRKLCGNIARGPATALTGRGRGVILNPEVAEFCRVLVLECAAVGRAEGADLPDSFVDRVVTSQYGAEEDATTSMLVDLLAGRPIEADGMTGAVVRLGARHGIDTPMTRMVNALLLEINTVARK